MRIGKFCTVVSIYVALGYALSKLATLLFSHLIQHITASSLSRILTEDEAASLLQSLHTLLWTSYILAPLLLWLLFNEPRRVRVLIGDRKSYLARPQFALIRRRPLRAKYIPPAGPT